MDNERRSSFGSKESIDGQRRNSKDNTEYVPTRCRITKPIPPKPAANPMQFVKIGPCELYRKAQEQLKKVEEVKAVRPEIRDEAEDWQANLDNWKSSRRKRQEHIIERVVEVKKFEEQQEMEKGRRKSKTFNEILEERKQRKNTVSISLYENDDPTDFSDYGIGGSRNSIDMEMSKTEDVTIDMENDNMTFTSNLATTVTLHQEEQGNERIMDNMEAQSNSTNANKTNILNYNESDFECNQNTNETMATSNNYNTKKEALNDNLINFDDQDDLLMNQLENDRNGMSKGENSTWNMNMNDSYKQEIDLQPETEQYTYESAIQGYRTRVISKTNLNPSFSVPTYKLEKQNIEQTNTDIVPKGSILKRKELFENDKLYELNHYESTTSRRLSDDFVHSQSLKERLLSLEKYTEQPLVNSGVDNSDVKNNNTTKLNDQFVRNRVSMFTGSSSALNDDNEEKAKSKSVICNNWTSKTASDRFSSPEPEEFPKNGNFHRSFDNLTDTTSESMPLDRHQSLEGLEYCHSNYPASNSSTELLVLSSQYGDTDREDSGIHTADVSCSVSQADEPVEDSEISTTEKTIVEEITNNNNTIINITSINGPCEEDSGVDSSAPLMSPAIPENPPLYPIDFVDTVFEDFSLMTALEPPKEKPPPPPIPDQAHDLSNEESELKRLNSTKRIKNEIRLKRSSFLGIDPEDQPEVEAVEASIRKPPDINSFLQKESRLEKQLYKKTQSSYSEAGDSQDSGVELERGRLSSDTWCSSLPDSAGATGIVHSRQNSEPCTTNSLTSEEDEIIKKEREIIELVEKEEKWRDTNDYPPVTSNFSSNNNHHHHIEPLPRTPVSSEVKKSTPEIIKQEHEVVAEYANSEDEEHSEVLRVEHELLQLEREELMFRESRARMQAKTCLKNKRLSLEDISGPQPHYTNMYQTDCMDYRKSMPELQREDYRKSMPELPAPSYNRAQSTTILSRSAHVSPIKHSHPRPVPREPYERDAFLPRKPNSNSNINNTEDEIFLNPPSNNKVAHPMSRHSLQMLSAAPRSRLIAQDTWIHPKPVVGDPREKYNYNQHWLIQEAEQRRLSEQQKFTVPPPAVPSWKMTRPEKHLPDSIIQTLTQRVQNKINLSDRNLHSRRMEGVPPGHYGAHSPHSVGHALPLHHPHLMMEESQDKMLSVSGKKKCSYCGKELGRGAAMIIESLCLFYHMDCFKCCVCHVQLGDGLMGTDVRVRNNKLHCHNCYSSDDGVKFSCV